MSSRNIVIVLISLLGGCLHAQEVTIFDVATNKGINGVTLSTTQKAVTTNQEGKANLAEFQLSDTVLLNHVSFSEQIVLVSELLRMKRIPMQRRSYDIPTYVISVNKWEQSERKISDHITVLDAKRIALENPSTAAELLASSGEVFVQKSQGGGGSPMIRGFAANRVLIVVDGVRMNNAIYRSGNLQNVLNVDPNMLRVAEVIHGPGAMTYGSDAIGGVMDFHTFDPLLKNDSTNTVTGSALLRRSTASAESTFNLRLNAATKKTALLFGFTHSDFGDPIMGSNGPSEYLRNSYVSTVNGIDTVVQNANPKRQIGNAFNLTHLLGKLRWKPDENWDIILSGRASFAPQIPRYDRLIQSRNGNPRSAEWYYDQQNWSMLNGKVEHSRDSGAWNTARLSVAYQFYEEGRTDRAFNSITRRQRNEEVQGFWVNLDFEKEFDKGTNLFYGFESVTNTVYSYGFEYDIDTFPSFDFRQINSRYPNNSEWFTYSAYASLTKDLGKEFVFNGGLRLNYSDLDVLFDTTLFPFPVRSVEIHNLGLTGSAGIIWNYAKKRKLSFDISRGFRSPNIDDIGKVFDSEPGALVVPNVDLDAEYVYSFELGHNNSFGNNISLNTNAYYTILTGAMVRRPFLLNGLDSVIYEGELSAVQAVQNAAEARVYGLHLGMNWKAKKHWVVALDVSVQNGEEETADGIIAPARHVPPTFGKLSGSWKNEKFTITAFISASGGFDFNSLAPNEQNKPHIYAIDSNGNPYSPSWYTANINTQCRLAKYATLSLALENITDIRFRTYSSGVVAPGRNIIATLRANF